MLNLLTLSGPQKLYFLLYKKQQKVKLLILLTEIICQIVLQEIKLSKNMIKTGKINSADDRPNQIPLKALPLLLLKYLEIVVDEVWDINP